MTQVKTVIGLDYGDKRIGVAVGNTLAKLASPYTTIKVDGQEIQAIEDVMAKEEVSMIVLGLPRGLDGQETDQTTKTRQFAQKLSVLGVEIVFQDEAGTSKQAEKEMKNYKKPIKHSIDAMAAAILLQDYLDLN